MTLTNLDEFRPPRCGTGDNGRFLLAEAKSHAFGVTEPRLRKLLAMLLMEHPDWMAETGGYEVPHAYRELLAGVLGPEQPIYYSAVQQYAYASYYRSRQYIQSRS